MSNSILILENDIEIRTILESKLKEAGHKVFSPIDSYVALEHIQEHGTDLIILNDQMPLINGKDMLTLIKQMSKPVPAIVFLSKLQQKEDYASFQPCICLHKPFQIADLLAHISSLLNR